MSFLHSLLRKPAPRQTVPSQRPLFIIGLGNPGERYHRTRHNLGWRLLDHLHDSWHGGNWHLEKKIQAEVSAVSRPEGKVFLVKPQTFMNHSGLSIQSLLSFYQAQAADIIVLHDEVDLPFGKIKTTLSSRAAGHNGVKDIIEKLGTQDFCRLRLGVGKSLNPTIDTAEYVLRNFSSEEEKGLPHFFRAAEDTLEAIRKHMRS